MIAKEHITELKTRQNGVVAGQHQKTAGNGMKRRTACKKWATVIILLIVYVNRGFFIVPYELEYYDSKETNSIAEWIIQTVAGESNDIDEDGDSHSDCNSVKTVSITVYQEFAQCLNLLNLYAVNMEKFTFPNKENLYPKDFYSQIDHPPQLG